MKHGRRSKRQGRTSSSYPPAVIRKLGRLKSLLKEHDKRAWIIGDEIIELIDRHHLKVIEIATLTGYAAGRISEFHRTARLFPTRDRDEGSFYDALEARLINSKIKGLGMTPVQIRREIISLDRKRPREIREHFLRKLTERQNRKVRRQSARSSKNGKDQLINACHHAKWEKIIPRLPDRSVKLFLCDPPFGGYGWKSGNSGYASGRSRTNGLRTDSDNNSSDEALETTLRLFELCLPKLAEGGALLLFQAGGKTDRPEILSEAEKQGWVAHYAVTWRKNTQSMCGRNDPYTPSSERILVFARQGDKLQWHEPNQSRSDVLEFPSVTKAIGVRVAAGKVAPRSIHMFQKPIELCEFLIRKHTYEGELVVEPFGCSGSGCIAALNLNRHWCYIESNKANFRWGRERIHLANDDQAAVATA